MEKLALRKMMTDIDTKIADWDERSSFRLKGVGNLSMSDLETLRLYAETYFRTGSIDSLMPLRGDLARVWEKYQK